MEPLCGGIDIGTSNSVIATYQKDGADCVITKQGKRIFPSLYATNTNGESYIGDPATAYIYSPAYFGVQYAKRVIGYKFNSERVSANPDLCIAKMRENKDGKVEFYKDGWNVTETPVSIYVKLLNCMLERTVEYRGRKLDKVVVTIPADFKQEQIADTEEAIRQVGFTEENYCLLKEPIAAAISYGFEDLLDGYTLVYDLGGGTFDCTIMQIRDNNLIILAYGGDEKIGGLAFDIRIREWVMEQVKEKKNMDICDPKSRSYARRMHKLLKNCRDAKEAMVSISSYDIDLYDIADEDVSDTMEMILLTRATMDHLLEPYITRTIEVVDNTIKKANIRKEDISRILMVGGSSRLLCAQKALTKHFGRDEILKYNVNPDEVVGLGAATFCHIWSQSKDKLSMTVNGRQINLIEVLTLTLGFKGRDGRMVALAKNGDPVPQKSLRKLLTTPVDNAECMRIEFYQGEKERAEENVRLRCFEWSNFPLLPKGQAKFVLSLYYVNSLWECEIRDFYTKQVYVERQRI